MQPKAWAFQCQQLAGHVNHSIFWTNLCPEKVGADHVNACILHHHPMQAIEGANPWR